MEGYHNDLKFFIQHSMVIINKQSLVFRLIIALYKLIY